MPDVRKDYFLDRKVIIAPERANKPWVFNQPDLVNSKCPFCKESFDSEKEISRVKINNWTIKCVPNKFPCVKKSGISKIKKKGILHSQPAVGNHEVIVETTNDNDQTWDMNKTELVSLLKMYSDRIEKLGSNEGTEYVMVYKNHGENSGGSVYHSHSQVVSLNFLPIDLKEEFEAYGLKSCNYCKVIKKEMRSERKCFENDDAVSFTPYASRFNYELWIFPKRHVKKLSQLNEVELKSLADILLKALRKLRKHNFPYNFVLKYSPEKFNSHFKIEIMPRLNKWAGMEMGAGLVVNSVSPEDSANFYNSR